MITDLLVQQIESCLPYEPNREQSELLQQLAAFVLDGRDDSLFLLRGYAGTGKTSLVGALVKALTQLQSKVVLLAPTGRAAVRVKMQRKGDSDALFTQVLNLARARVIVEE